jgi:tRNA-dihydrouridine synthase A
MIGRAAYQNPAMLAGVDALLGSEGSALDRFAAAERMIPYAEAHCAAGGRLASVTRHMIGLFQGQPGARRWRQILTVEASKPGAGPDVIRRALEAVGEAPRLDAAA